MLTGVTVQLSASAYFVVQSVGNILQRLKKHFANDTDPSLVEELWKHVQKYLSGRYKRYETIVHAAYQVSVCVRVLLFS